MKKNIFYKIGFTIVLIIICVSFCYFHNSFETKEMKIMKYKRIDENYLNPLRNCEVIITQFHIGFGKEESIGIELATPYSSKRQMTDILKKEVKIKNDFLMNVEENDIKKWVKTKNFMAIKTKFIQITNNYLDEPIEKVYLSRFFYE
ncbi:MAG: hypothetical protein PVG39_19975 [Desulfobacteraceae bacterium]